MPIDYNLYHPKWSLISYLVRVKRANNCCEWCDARHERTPVDRAASASDLANFKETEIQMTETSEVPVVSKEARVVEEVSLDKEVSQRTETISDTVRKTEVDVEDLDKSTASTNTTGF